MAFTAGEIGMPVREKGSVLVIVLLVITAVTMLGMMSINASVIELFITRNEREARENFYLAESGVMEAARRLANADAVDLAEKHLTWHHDAKSSDPEWVNFRDGDAWDMDGRDEDNAIQSAIDDDVFIAAVEQRLAAGSSAIVTESRLYMNRIFGMSRKYEACHVIEMGYDLRY